MVRYARNAVYAGSFDPVTNGHLWMITEGAGLFDNLVVVVADNPAKKTMFSSDERVAMIKVSLPSGIASENVTVMSATNAFLVDVARAMNAQCLLRGLRTAADFEYERSLRHVNEDIDRRLNTHPSGTLNPGPGARIHTVFLMPPRELAEISSSFVKSLVGLGHWERIVAGYVPEVVLRGLQLKDQAPLQRIAEGHGKGAIIGANPANLDKPVLEVRHGDLTLAGRSPFRSKCPACPDGLLLVRRQDEPPFRLLRYDRCIRCAQLVKYLDDTICGERVTDAEKTTVG